MNSMSGKTAKMLARALALSSAVPPGTNRDGRQTLSSADQRLAGPNRRFGARALPLSRACRANDRPWCAAANTGLSSASRRQTLAIDLNQSQHFASWYFCDRFYMVIARTNDSETQADVAGVGYTPFVVAGDKNG